MRETMLMKNSPRTSWQAGQMMCAASGSSLSPSQLLGQGEGGHHLPLIVAFRPPSVMKLVLGGAHHLRPFPWRAAVEAAVPGTLSKFL